MILKHLILTSKNIFKIAKEVGFDACGIAPAKCLTQAARYMDEWIAQGGHGNMTYLERNREKRYDPTLLVDGAKAIIVCLLSYKHSGKDYHRKVKSMLYTLEAALREEFGEGIVSLTQQHIFCDSAPILERQWCVEAGLGFIGKNRQFIHPTLGSMVHPGEIIINCDVDDTYILECHQKDTKNINSFCENCQLCVEACPTNALNHSIWDARKCVAYTTHFCLECQRVCPFNNNLS